MRQSTVIVLLVVVVWGNSACTSAVASSTLVPGFLIGTWRTDTESHQDAFLRLTATTIAFGTVEDSIERYAVLSVTRTEDWYGELYTIRYRDVAGDEQTISFYYDDQVLKLQNQRRMNWTWSRY